MKNGHLISGEVAIRTEWMVSGKLKMLDPSKRNLRGSLAGLKPWDEGVHFLDWDQRGFQQVSLGCEHCPHAVEEDIRTTFQDQTGQGLKVN